jgi:hypothetical protein
LRALGAILPDTRVAAAASEDDDAAAHDWNLLG